MGQYHIVANLDKQEFFTPHQLGLGAKQWEHFSGDASIPQAIYLLVTASPMRGGGDIIINETDPSIIGRWVGDRVVVLGDYTEDSDMPSYGHFGSVYSETATEEWTNISEQVAIAFSEIFPVTYSGTGWKQRKFADSEF